MRTLYTRDLKERMEELEDELNVLNDAVNEAEENDLEGAKDDLKEYESSEEFEELKELRSMADEVSEWDDGNQLIPEDDFEEYCQELLEDIGDLPKNLPWYIAIDWEKTADNLKADYSEIDYQGTTYLYRQS